MGALLEIAIDHKGHKYRGGRKKNRRSKRSYKGFYTVVWKSIIGDKGQGPLAPSLFPSFDSQLKSLLRPPQTLEFWKTQSKEWSSIARNLWRNLNETKKLMIEYSESEQHLPLSVLSVST